MTDTLDRGATAPEAARLDTARIVLEDGYPELVSRQAIRELMSSFSIETTPGGAAKVDDFRQHLTPGTHVAVTFLPGSDWRDTVATARRLRAEGMEPVPHLAARSLPDAHALERYLEALVAEAQVTQAVVLAGAVNRPVGDFTDSLQLLDTGAFERHGIRRIGVAGHPEGSPDIPEAAAWDALQRKQDYALRTGAEIYICTQFAFEAAPILTWDRALRQAGIELPVHIGVPGLATLKTLINHARACGVGPSVRFLTRQARNVSKLMTVNAPDQLVRDLAEHLIEDPESNIRALHLYPLGGLKKSAAWANTVAGGRFEITRQGFAADPSAV